MANADANINAMEGDQNNEADETVEEPVVDNLEAVPMRVTDPADPDTAAGAPDVVHTGAAPANTIERYLREVPFLITTAMTSTDARMRTLSLAALSRRISGHGVRQALSDFSEQAMALHTMAKSQSTDVDLDLVPKPRFGNTATVNGKAKKDFLASTNNCVLASASDERAPELARLIFNAAKTVIEAFNLSEKAAFDLVRSSIAGEFAETLRHYASTNQYGSFAHLVQFLCLPTTSSSTLNRRLYELLHTRPNPSRLGSVINEIITISRKLAQTIPHSDRQAAFRASAKASLNSLISLWYPVHGEQVEDRVRSLLLQNETEVATARQMGDLEEAQRIQNRFCPVAALGESILYTLRMIEPAAEMNKIITSPNPKENREKRVHSNEVQQGQMPPMILPQAQFAPAPPPPQQQMYPPGSLGAMAFAPSAPMQGWGQPPQVFSVAGPSPPPVPKVATPATYWPQGAYAHPSANLQEDPYGVQGPAAQEQVLPDHEPFNGSGATEIPVMAVGQQGWNRNPGQQQGAGNMQFPARPSPEELARLRPNPLLQGQLGAAAGGNPRPQVRCPLCGAHNLYRRDGALAICYRYPALSEAEMRMKCERCGCMHPTAKCLAQYNISQLYATPPWDNARPDRIPPPNGGFPFVNPPPQAQGPNPAQAPQK